MIIYNSIKSILGNIFIAKHNNKIIYLAFADKHNNNQETHLNNIKNFDYFIKYPNIKFIKDYKINSEYINNILINIKNINPNKIINYLDYKHYTDFQKLVIQNLITIPVGTTVSYQGLANKINKPKAFRAVANCIANNHIAFFIPCHRVIGKNGKLTGYKWGLDIKQKLLNWELGL